jgi:7-cyano-7-deazaguanine synthase
MIVPQASKLGVLLSGGLDSSILVAHLLDMGYAVQPIFIRTGVNWQMEEEAAVRRFTSAISSGQLFDLVPLEMPLGDLYADHWSISGKGVPSINSADEAVYLPGRNPLLLVKAAVWCQMHGIEELAVATLESNPFADAREDFFAAFERAVTLAVETPLRIVRPFASLSKKEVMELGRGYPLEHTFSCIAPRRGMHCGQCNKCGERKMAFEIAGLDDPTCYASDRAAAHRRTCL